MMTITLDHATRIVDLLTHGLVRGIGVQKPGEMCVEAAVCYALGLPHSDDPGCVSPALRQLKIFLNDAPWSSNIARAEGLKRLALVQLGSKGVVNDVEFVRRVIDVTIRRIVPMALLAAAQVHPNYTAALEMCAVRCEQEGTVESCKEATRVARYYADVSASAFAFASAASAADDAAVAAAYAASAAIAAVAYAADQTRDHVLADYAEWIVEILIDMQAPGVQWLHLAPKA